MESSLSTARILVTGGSGFIGTNAVERFRRSGATVSSVDNVKPMNRAHRAEFSQIDLLDEASICAHVADFNPTHVVHLGARTDLHGVKISDYKANTEGVANLIRAIQSSDTQRVIFASSRLVCRIGYLPANDNDYCPDTPYGASKVEGEQLVRDTAPHDLAWTIVRPTSIWGPWFGVPYRTFFDSVLSGRYGHPANMAIKKSFGFVGNSVFQLERILLADREKIDTRTFYLGDAPPIDVLEFANAIRKAAGQRPVRHLPVGTLKAIAHAGDFAQRLTKRDMPLTSFRLANMLSDMVYNLDDVTEIASSLPFSMEEGVALTLEWMNEASG